MSARAEAGARGQAGARPRSTGRGLLAVLLTLAALLTSSSAFAQLLPDSDDVLSALGQGGSGNVSLNCTSNDTLAAGQAKIDQGQYEEAIRVFSCVIQANPQTVDAYRGRSEAKLLLNRFSDAFNDIFALLISTTQPSDIFAQADTIISSYDARLAAQPSDVPALTGGSFVRWAYFQYDGAIPLLEQLLTLNPNNLYAKTFRGSNRLFLGSDVAGGVADLEAAIALSPTSAHVRYIVADAYTYAYPDAERAYDEATLALNGGLNTPRVHAILAAALNEWGELLDAADEINTHISLSTTMSSYAGTLYTGGVKHLNLVPKKVYEINIPAYGGQTITLATNSTSSNIWDSIMVLVDPFGCPIVGNDDDAEDYLASLTWVAPYSGVYKLRVTSFEAINTAPLDVSRN